MSQWRLGVGLLAAIGYAALSYGLMLHAAGQPWAVAALLGPLLLMALAVALRRRHAPTLVALAFAGLGIAGVVARGGVADINRLYVLQYVGIHLALCATFASTLRRGRPSLIGRVAQQVHGTLTPDMLAYTHRLTVVWAAYFISMAALSLGVYAVCSWAAWSLLANVMTPLAVAGLFVGEYLLRYRLHPEFEHASLMDAVRAYRRGKGLP